MAQLFIVRHGKRQGNDLVPDGLAQIEALGDAIRPHVLPVQDGEAWKEPRSNIWLSSLALWVIKTTLALQVGGGNLVGARVLEADADLHEEQVVKATAFVAEFLAIHEVVVVVTHGVVTAKLPSALGEHLGIQGVHPSKTALTYAQAVHIDTVAKTWRYIKP